MALSDTQIRSAKGGNKPYKMFDTNGLFLIVSKVGGKSWRFKYRYDNKDMTISFGKYPEISLKEARTKRDETRKLLEQGKNPVIEKKRQAIERSMANRATFRAIAEEYIEKRVGDGISDATQSKAKWFLSLLDADLGGRPISDIAPFEILDSLRKIEKKGNHETAKRVRAFASRVFTYAIITCRAQINPAAHLSGALIAPKTKHHAAIIEPLAVGALLRN